MKFNSNAREKTLRNATRLIFAGCIFLQSFVSGARAQENIIVVLGDSLVAGYGLAPGKAFPEQLSIMLKERGYDTEIINAGVSGDTSAGGLSRLDWSVQQGTTGVILELGANDALRGLPPQETKKNLENIIINLKKKNIKILLAGMQAPPNMGQDYVDKFNAIYPQLAKKFDLVFYPFFLEGIAGEAKLNQADGIHPTAPGVIKLTTSFLPSALTFIERLNAR